MAEGHTSQQSHTAHWACHHQWHRCNHPQWQQQGCLALSSWELLAPKMGCVVLCHTCNAAVHVTWIIVSSRQALASTCCDTTSGAHETCNQLTQDKRSAPPVANTMTSSMPDATTARNVTCNTCHRMQDTPQHGVEPLSTISSAHDKDTVPPGVCCSKGSCAI